MMPTVVLSGDLDIYALPYVRAALSRVNGPAVVDLSGVRLITAVALTELHRAAQRAGPGAVTLAGASPHVQRVLEIVEFHRLFRIGEGVLDCAQ